jgi:hypothetical protein
MPSVPFLDVKQILMLMHKHEYVRNAIKRAIDAENNSASVQ